MSKTDDIDTICEHDYFLDIINGGFFSTNSEIEAHDKFNSTKSACVLYYKGKRIGERYFEYDDIMDELLDMQEISNDNMEAEMVEL